MKILPLNMLPKFFTLLMIVWFSNSLMAQYVPVPAPPQAQAIVVRGATAHLGNGQVIENSTVAFENGRFSFVGGAEGRGEFPNHLVIDGSGMQLYPGFIAPNTTLGLAEIEQVKASRDDAEIGELNPNVRSLVAYNTDSEVTPTVRSMGVLLAETVPQGGRISGTSSLVVLDAWNWEDAAYIADVAIHLNWPPVTTYNWRERRSSKNEKYEEQVREVEDFFRQAQAYFQKAAPETANLRFEAMAGLFSGEQRLIVHADDVQAMQDAVLMARKFSLAPTIAGGQDAWRITDFLKKYDVPVILQPTQSLPAREDEDIDQPFRTPAQLQQAGLLWCFSQEGFWKQRNLAFQAGQSVSFGLPYEDAIRALTSSTARIFGVDKTVGTIEVGKDATFFLCQGDVLDMRTSKVARAFIQGRDINLDNKQEMLYRKFKQKYKQR